METISLDSKQFTKASSLARDFGYTADYVGQLCRAGKVEAQLVGRSWYVARESLEQHKRGRHRSSAAKTKLAIKQAVADAAQPVSVTVKKSSVSDQQFYAHAPLSRNSVSYEPDTEELLPVVKKPISVKKNIRVSLADAESVKVKSQSPSYSMTTTARSAVRFSGKIAVVDSELGLAPEAPLAPPEAPKPKSVPPVAVPRAKRTDEQRENLKLRTPVKKENPTRSSGRLVHLPISEHDTPSLHSGRYLFVRLSVSLVLGFLIILPVLTLSSKVIASTQSVSGVYQLQLDTGHLAALLKYLE